MDKSNASSSLGIFIVGFVAGLLAFDFMRKNASPELQESLSKAKRTVNDAAQKGKDLIQQAESKAKTSRNSGDLPPDNSDILSQPMP